ncbi:MAG: type 4a pilus biogenesis protein PilO [Deltaproteobacteria bacterium]|nr:type 4a pilus biogenesis protein PilO [Deltaproteobacteria bacterium]
MAKVNLKDKANPREAFLGFLVTLLLCFVFLNMMLIPRCEKMDELKTQVKTAQGEKKVIELGMDALKKRGKPKKPGQATGNPKIDVINSARVNEFPKFTDFMSVLTGADFQRGMAFDSLTYLPEEKGKGYSRVPFTLKARGSFAAAVPFIEKLDTTPALVTVDSIKIEANEKMKGEMVIDLTASFYQWEGSHAKKIKP